MKSQFSGLKQLRYTKIMLAAALFAAPLAAQAAAPSGPELSFHPTRAWSVRAVEGADIGSAGPACTLANEFNNGFVIQITGTQAGPNNMNIDFRQPVFETGNSYEVRLSVPARESRVYAGQAAGEALLVLGMENSRDLFEAMRGSGVVDMSVEGNEFRFYLTGIADATSRFDGCVRGEDVNIATELPRGLKQLPLEDLEISAPEPATEEGGTVSGLYEQDRAALVPVQEIVPPLPAPEIATAAQREEERQKNLISRQSDAERVSLTRPEPPRHKRLSEQLAEQLNQAPVPEKEPLEIDLTGLTEAEEAGTPETEMQERSDSIDWSAPRAAPGPARIQARTPEPIVTRKEASGAADLTGVYMPDEAPPPESAPERIEPSSSDVFSNRDDIAGLTRKISELENMVRELRDENSMLDDELKLALEAAQEERVAISSENWNLERATMRFNEAERQIKRMGQQLQRERAECEVEKKELQSLLFDPAVTDQRQIATLADLEGKLRETEEELELQRRRYEERIRILEERLGSQ